MNRFLIWLMGIALVGCAVDTPPGTILQHYDRFKDGTVVFFQPVYVKGPSFSYDGTLTLSASYVSKGQTPSRPKEVFLEFVSDSRNWRYLTNQNLIFLIDGERTNFGKGVRASRVYMGGVTEVISFTVPLEKFNKLANASSVEGQLADTEFAFDEKSREAFRSFASRIPAAQESKPTNPSQEATAPQ